MGWGPTAGGIGLALFLLVVLSLWLGLLALWILAIVDIAKRPDWQFRQAGQEKMVWLLLTIFINVVAIVYWLAIRKRLVAIEQAAASRGFGPASEPPGPWLPGPAGPWPSGQPGPSAVGSPAWSPPGWYPDPGGQHRYRYWDGLTWTDSVSDPAPPIPSVADPGDGSVEPPRPPAPSVPPG